VRANVRVLLGLVMAQPRRAGGGATGSMMVITHLAAAVDHQGAAVDHQGATIDRMGAASGHQGATVNRQVPSSTVRMLPSTI
jgi:hypothetical protein